MLCDARPARNTRPSGLREVLASGSADETLKASPACLLSSKRRAEQWVVEKDQLHGPRLAGVGRQ